MVVIDERLSKGLVRAETRTLRDTLRDHGHEVFVTLMEGISPRFRTESRLRPDEVRAVASALHEKAGFAYNSLFSDLVLVPPTKGRPNSGAYEMLHYWIRPVKVPDDPYHQMRIAVFTANGDRKNVEMSAHDTLISFYEHAAHRLHQRCGGQQAAVCAIGRHLVETIILPALAFENATESLIGTELHIPFEGGLLLGRFIQRPQTDLPGAYFRIHNRRVREGRLSSDSKVEFLVKTFLSADMLSDRQTWAAYEVDAWLNRHRDAAATIRRHLFHPGIALSDCVYVSPEDHEALKADFHRMRDNVFGPPTS